MQQYEPQAMPLFQRGFVARIALGESGIYAKITLDAP
jgi:hypothetical protein